MNEHLRQTGRSTRLLEKAMYEAMCGRAVYVVALTDAHAKDLRYRFGVLWEKHQGGRPHGVKFETPGRLGNFDWRTMSLPLAHPNCVLLLDHTVVERRIAHINEDIQRLVAEAAKLYPLTV